MERLRFIYVNIAHITRNLRLFNALLGYGYGVLFTELEKAVILSGLDPYMGFLHADRAGKPSMVLDLMEEWRQPIVDRSMITLVSRKVVQQNNLMLNNIISYNNFRHSFSSLILMQARGVVKFINGENGLYTPFIYGR
ncbi:MAG: CRISPR-associated endonuclease Cas1 [Candidatus Methanoperedens sp.]|nr:CRISPR-associated endonuclease Cas1 [Candidatus Methanoperedens sp.]